jgi:tetrahydromethanopterin S-methyltransferase subunit B
MHSVSPRTKCVAIAGVISALVSGILVGTALLLVVQIGILITGG